MTSSRTRSRLTRWVKKQELVFYPVVSVNILIYSPCHFRKGFWNCDIVFHAIGFKVFYSCTKYTEKDWVRLKVRHYPLQCFHYNSLFLHVAFNSHLFTLVLFSIEYTEKDWTRLYVRHYTLHFPFAIYQSTRTNLTSIYNAGMSSSILNCLSGIRYEIRYDIVEINRETHSSLVSLRNLC